MPGSPSALCSFLFSKRSFFLYLPSCLEVLVKALLVFVGSKETRIHSNLYSHHAHMHFVFISVIQMHCCRYMLLVGNGVLSNLPVKTGRAAFFHPVCQLINRYYHTDDSFANQVT